MKKIISILLSLAIICCLPIAVSAEDSPAYYIEISSNFPGIIHINPTSQQTDLSKFKIELKILNQDSSNFTAYVDSSLAEYKKDPWCVDLAKSIKTSITNENHILTVVYQFDNTLDVSESQVKIATRIARNDWSNYDHSKYSFTVYYDGATVYSEQPAINENSNEKSADVDVSAMVNPSYTVTIPSKVELNSTATVSATNVLTEAGKAVKVTLLGTNQSDNAFLVKSAEGSTIGYQILKSDGSKYSVNNSLLFETDGDEPLEFKQIASDKVYAGSYKGIVNFDISYGSIH